MQEREPRDAVPQGYSGQPDPRYAPQPQATPQYYPPPQPVIVNVVQNAYRPRPVYVHRRVNHTLHFWLTILTGGAWLFVWIPVAIKGGKRVAVYR